MKKTVVIIFILLFSVVSHGQKSKPDHKKIYKVNFKSEIPITIGLFALNYYGFTLLGEKAPLDSLQIVSLDINDVWAFDRVALTQDPSQRIKAHDISDWGMNISLLLPAFLALDKDIRQDWADLLVLYFETQAINSTLYAYGGPMLTKRIRPFVYYDEVPFDEKTGTGTTDSFFSGHTSTTATASFFMAKVYSDYHPELGNKKFLLFGAALIPPAIVGYYRYRALKHFPTDIITGTVIGAATGILVPQLHKIVKRKNENLSVLPYAGKYSGIAVSLKF